MRLKVTIETFRDEEKVLYLELSKKNSIEELILDKVFVVQVEQSNVYHLEDYNWVFIV